MCIKQLVHAFRQFRQGISNLVTWFPIIWKDGDFDYGYLLELVEFKSNRMLKFLESDDTTTDWNEEKAKEDLIALRRFVPLLRYIHDQQYENDAFEEWHKEFPNTRNLEFVEMEPPDPKFKMMKPFTKEESKRFKYWMKVSESDYKIAMKKMGDILLNHMRGWWD
jgi:hypothetical protein